MQKGFYNKLMAITKENPLHKSDMIQLLTDYSKFLDKNNRRDAALSVLKKVEELKQGK